MSWLCNSSHWTGLGFQFCEEETSPHLALLILFPGSTRMSEGCETTSPQPKGYGLASPYEICHQSPIFSLKSSCNICNW